MGKGGLWVTSFIYKYKTSTTYYLYETMQWFVLKNKWHLWVQSALPTSAFTHNPGTTKYFVCKMAFMCISCICRLLVWRYFVLPTNCAIDPLLEYLDANLVNTLYNPCDQTVRLSLIFGHLQQLKIAQKHKKFAKVSSKFCPMPNKGSGNCQWRTIFQQSGEISPNLVTLNFRCNLVTLKRSFRSMLFF